MARDWRSAFLLQACSDFEIFTSLNWQGVPVCHRLHYLQMATEKLAKGFLTSPGQAPIQSTHQAFLRFVRSAANVPRLRQVSGMRNSKSFNQYLKGLEPMAQSIEELAPVREPPRPNPEYPWDIQGQVTAPVEHEFTNLDLHSPKMLKMIRFLDLCFIIAEAEIKSGSQL